MEKLYFNGHETFHCRHFWLKKGIDYMLEPKLFTEKTAVVDLGVGKNMVSSIRFWLRAFGLSIYDKNNSNESVSTIAHHIFGKDGFDPYLENIASIWLLHYFLIKTKRSSIYSLVFNKFRKERIEFTKNSLQEFLIRTCQEKGINYNENTIKKDAGVFIRNYLRPTVKEIKGQKREQNIEEDFSALLIDLDLLHETIRIGDKFKWYKIENTERKNLAPEIVLFSILDNPLYENTSSISFTSLLNDPDSIGSIYALSPDGLMGQIDQLCLLFPNDLVYTDDAGIRELQFKKERPNKWDVLKKYYAK
mgnify:CR=1 FL=1